MLSSEKQVNAWHILVWNGRLWSVEDVAVKVFGAERRLDTAGCEEVTGTFEGWADACAALQRIRAGGYQTLAVALAGPRSGCSLNEI